MHRCFTRRHSTLDTAGPSLQVEWKERWHHCVWGVYNPASCVVEWRSCWNGGVHGAWNPATAAVEWRKQRRHGVWGVYNPATRAVEWRTQKDGGVHGVWNPATQTIEWRSRLHHGVWGVFNPAKREVEWRSQRAGGIVGYYSAAQGCVEWVEEGSQTGGVGMVVHAAKLSSRWSGRWSGRQGESTSDKTLSPGESAEGRGMEAEGPAYLSLACGIWGWWEEEDLWGRQPHCVTRADGWICACCREFTLEAVRPSAPPRQQEGVGRVCYTLVVLRGGAMHSSMSILESCKSQRCKSSCVCN